MIYKTGYFRKELRQIYNANRTSTSRRLAFAVFLGLFSFALFFVFQTLQKSVLSEVAPQIMQPSFFSTLYIYVHMSYALNTAYFIFFYDSLFFSEIRKNSWYLLVQMGYNPVMMIFSKLTALLYSLFIIYTVGFTCTVFMTLFLKYPFVFAYMPSLFIAGFVDLMLVGILCMTLSLYVKVLINARYLALLSAVFVILLKVLLGYYAVLSNRVVMQNLFNLADPRRSLFLPAAVVLIVVCGLISVFGARNVAKYYTLPTDSYPLPPETLLAGVDPKTGRLKAAVNNEKRLKYGKIIDVTVTACLIVLICATLAFNAMIILINTATPGNEVTIRGVIPYVFKSDTMAPEIMQNDLAYFTKIDSMYPVKPGEIILFKSDNVIYVEKVIDRQGNAFIADIINYPPMSQTGSMIKTVPRGSIIGVYTGRNRWLGALILFANTIIGRLIFLFVPAVFLFYHKQIANLYRRRK